MANSLSLKPEQKHAIETEVSPAAVQANQMVVKSEEHRSSAVAFVKGLKALKAKIEERFHPTDNKKRAYETYQAALDTEKAFYTPIDAAITTVNKKVKTFDTQEALRIQREAQAAEAKRQEEERKEREKLEARAKKAEEKGKPEKAEVLREQAENVTVAPNFTPPPSAPKKLVWKARVTNVFQLCKAIASGQVPFNVVEVRMSALNDFAKGHDGKTKN